MEKSYIMRSFISCTLLQIKDVIVRTCSMHGRYGKCILVGKPERKRPLGRPMRRWEDNIIMDFREIQWGSYGLVLSASG
jgi:hypothetical protein